MKGELLPGGRVWRRATQLVAASLSIAVTGAVGGCLSRPLEPIEPKTTSVVVERLTESSVDKIDLLLMIDNSRSMADKQTILVEAVPDLVKGLVNPKCIDQTTMLPSAMQPAGPTDPCPDAASKRDFNPVLDIHIGIVTSSIGGHGSDACPNTETFSCPGGATNSTNNDAGHLVSRQSACAGGTVPTYQNKGFLAWDPKAKLMPAGEANIGSINIDVTTGVVTDGSPGLVSSLKDLVLGTDQIGCGYESQHESWYRFLVDPSPYQSIVIDSQGRANPMGIDNVLIQQRKDFLRPSSLLAIIALTDENDCSIKEYGQFYFVAQQRDPGNPNKNFYLPKPRSECATNPNDKCCRSCGQDQTGCPVDPVCATGSLDAKSDDVNLRCWDTKRRFGIDFLYPIDRYTQGLTSATVPDRMGNLVGNPIFSVLDPSSADTNVRDASLVFVAYITGVPWQDIAVDPKDLKKGLKTSAQLLTPDPTTHKTTWDYILGDPDNYVKPLDPHMIESITPRTGTDPITGVALAPPTAAAGTDAINGHEYTPGTMMGVQAVADDLEYACIFTLPTPRDCSDPAIVSCDCSDPKNDNPLCEPDPSKGGNRTLQVRAKGYPGIRELQLIKSMQAQGIVGSICPAQLTDLNGDDFGYRPAIGAIINRLKVALGGQCLPRQLTPDSKGQVTCLILEARNSGGSCDCTSSGRQAVDPSNQAAVQAAQADPIAKASNWDCFCEITQLNNGPLNAQGQDTNPNDDQLKGCQNDVNDPPIVGGAQVDGWCYIDATINPAVGNPDIVAKCPDTEKRLVRFVGNGNPKPGSTLFITCSGD